MKIEKFIGVGENIHCTRIYKVGGKFAVEAAAGGYEILYKSGGESKALPIPKSFMEGSAWEAGKVKHCAVAIYQGVYGDDAGKVSGLDYIQALARRQEAAGATYLDINVDEFSTDVEERMRLMEWTVKVVQEAVAIPMSIDSSDIDILKAGLAACDLSRDKPMVNSLSLERMDVIEVAAAAKAVVIASASGESGLPANTEERLENLDRLMPVLENAGFVKDDIHIDPLVFPISVDGTNGVGFLDAVSAVREKYGPEIHIVAGLSNISFGMPSRKLINQVFTYLAVEAGADGGIVDPMHINADVINTMDTESNSFMMTKALLLGEDDFGMNFITAMREGTL
ncbi:MAG: dihydropteroate synthase [Kiritimatiellae bacterium]|nr:dihydropteroate synthase [Kiritimatiellia bacterium]